VLKSSEGGDSSGSHKPYKIAFGILACFIKKDI